MTDKLSEVARAILVQRYSNYAGYGKYEPGAVEIEETLPEAKAAIEAYRDPTDEMVEAVQIAIGGKLSWGLIETILRAGADAALELK